MGEREGETIKRRVVLKPHYRIKKHRATINGKDHIWFGLHKVYYLDGEMVGVTKNPEVKSSGLEDLIDKVRLMAQDITRFAIIDEWGVT